MILCIWLITFLLNFQTVNKKKVCVVNSRICSEILKHSLVTLTFFRISSTYFLAKIIKVLPRMANSFLRKKPENI